MGSLDTCCWWGCCGVVASAGLGSAGDDLPPVQGGLFLHRRLQRNDSGIAGRGTCCFHWGFLGLVSYTNACIQMSRQRAAADLPPIFAPHSKALSVSIGSRSAMRIFKGRPCMQSLADRMASGLLCLLWIRVQQKCAHVFQKDLPSSSESVASIETLSSDCSSSDTSDDERGQQLQQQQQRRSHRVLRVAGMQGTTGEGEAPGVAGVSSIFSRTPC